MAEAAKALEQTSIIEAIMRGAEISSDCTPCCDSCIIRLNTSDFDHFDHSSSTQTQSNFATTRKKFSQTRKKNTKTAKSSHETK
jgi:hypothetical protein